MEEIFCPMELYDNDSVVVSLDCLQGVLTQNVGGAFDLSRVPGRLLGKSHFRLSNAAFLRSIYFDSQELSFEDDLDGRKVVISIMDSLPNGVQNKFGKLDTELTSTHLRSRRLDDVSSAVGDIAIVALCVLMILFCSFCSIANFNAYRRLNAGEDVNSRTVFTSVGGIVDRSL